MHTPSRPQLQFTMMKSASTGNPVVQLLSSLQKQDGSDPYLILVQHSLSFSQRQTAASTDKDLAVYRMAQVTPPSERAQLDSRGNLWLSELSQHCTSKLVWVETIGTGMRPSTPTCQVVFLSAGIDPLGWDRSESSQVEKTSIANLQTLAGIIIGEASPNAMIILESIAPLISMHGLDRTVDFLTHLLKHTVSTTLIIPVLTECLAQPHHVILEDLADAVLILEGGEATLMRRGVRERANLLREPVHIEITDRGLKLLSTDNTTANVNKSSAKSVDAKVDRSAPAPAVVPVSSMSRPGRITLRHDDNHVAVAEVPNVPTPRIYLQDNDPEFDDMDEEDPDDDLDI